MDAEGEMDMQLNLSPRLENRYHVTNAQWKKLKVTFSKDADTHCTLSRVTVDEGFEGKCVSPDDETVVSFISLRFIPVPQPEGDD